MNDEVNNDEHPVAARVAAATAIEDASVAD